MLVCTATISADHWLVGSIPQNYTIVERRRRICSVTFFCFINNTYLASSWGVCRPAPVGSDCSSWGVWLLGGLDPPPQHWLALLGGLDPPPQHHPALLGGPDPPPAASWSNQKGTPPQERIVVSPCLESNKVTCQMLPDVARHRVPW